jgi:hypothetical protein
LQRRAALAARQWHEEAGIETVAARGLDLAMDEFQRPVPIHRQDLIRKASEVHES